VLEKRRYEAPLAQCIPHNLQEKYSFYAFVEKRQHEIAIASLVDDEMSAKISSDYIRAALKIENAEMRHKIIDKILRNTALYASGFDKHFFTDFVNIVVSLQNKPYFEEYLSVLQPKLLQQADPNSYRWQYDDNQELQEQFMAMYTFLGAEHQLIKTIPKEIIASHLKKYRENQKEKK
jgi:hypothetical protein